jgi:transcriptional regulator with XRE-family HTH domain
VSVYFVQVGSDGPIKIGKANDVAFRIQALQTAAPGPLRLLAVAAGGLAEEQRLHERFSKHRLHGEWFSPHPDLLAHIAAVTPVPDLAPSHKSHMSAANSKRRMRLRTLAQTGPVSFRALCDARGKGHADLAAACGVSREMAKRWWRNVVVPSTEHAPVLAELLGREEVYAYFASRPVAQRGRPTTDARLIRDVRMVASGLRARAANQTKVANDLLEFLKEIGGGGQ